MEIVICEEENYGGKCKRQRHRFKKIKRGNQEWESILEPMASVVKLVLI